MKSPLRSAALIALLLLGTLACSLLDKALNQATGGDDNLQIVGSLWSDVPAMEGMQRSEIDMPLPVKLLFNTILGNLGKMNPDGMDQTTGKVDWIVFSSDKEPGDVKAFYTPERMSADGWEADADSPCLSGADQGVQQVGLMCVFSKQENGMGKLLAIIAVPDDQAQKMNIFFLRLEVQPTPVPG